MRFWFGFDLHIWSGIAFHFARALTRGSVLRERVGHDKGGRFGNGGAAQFNRRSVALDHSIGAKELRGHAGRAEERLANKGPRIGNGDMGDGVESVFGGEGLGLIESFAGDNGEIDPPVICLCIPNQFIQTVWRRPVKRLTDRRITGQCGSRGVRGRVFDRSVENLAVGDHQLRRQTAPRDRGGQRTQACQFGLHVGIVERDLAHDMPPRRRAVEQLDAIVAQVQRKIRFHSCNLPTHSHAAPSL